MIIPDLYLCKSEWEVGGFQRERQLYNELNKYICVFLIQLNDNVVHGQLKRQYLPKFL